MDYSKFNKDDLYNDYVINNLSRKEMLEKYNINNFTALNRVFQYFNITKPIFSVSDDELKKFYIDDNLSLKEMANKYNLSKSRMFAILSEKNIHKTSEQISENRIKSFIDKYGVKVPIQIDSVKDKIKKTNNDKYGHDYIFQTDEFKNKNKELHKIKYGDRKPIILDRIENVMPVGSYIMSKYEISYDELYNLYITQNKTIKEISELKSCSIFFLNTKIKEYNIRKDKSQIYESVKSTCLQKYGMTNAGYSEAAREKIKKTCQEKYGVDNPGKIKSAQEKKKETNLLKYGTESPLGNSEIRQKAIKTIYDRYGVTNIFQSQEIKNKISQTIMEIYGESNVAKSDIVKNKIKQTNLEKYGTECVLSNPEIREKIYETNMKKYGYKTPSQNKELMDSVISKIPKTEASDTSNEQFKDLLETNNIQYEKEYKINNKSYDFKINNILVEINPTATHNSTWGIFGNPLDKNYHSGKSILAKENGFSCIHVFDWDDKTKIISMLKNKTKIYARKCEIKEIDENECNTFLNENHLQGTCRGQFVRLGLFYNNELVELMTFGKPRYNGKYQYELLRLCTRKDLLVIGGAGKLFKYFIENNNPKNIISYCDNSKFSGEIYSTLGFELENNGAPTIHWYNIKTNQHITDNLLRQRGFDQLFKTNYGKEKTNAELMLMAGFVQIYDCGQAKYVWEKKI